MSSFAQQVTSPKAKRAAPRVFTLEPDHFAEGFERRPTIPVDVGLRVPSEAQIQVAQIEAEKLEADANEAEKVRAYNSHLMMFVVARGLCNPLDVTQPSPLFELPEELVPVALKSGTIERLFDEIERLAVEQSPAFEPATLAQLRELGELLQVDDPLQGLDAVARNRCARYARLILDTLNDGE